MSERTEVGSGARSELIAFNIGSQEFCLSTASAREIRGWTPAAALPHAPDFVLGVVNLRGVVLPIIDLAVRLGFPPTEPTARHAIIVAEVGRQVAGLLVDGVSDIFTADEEQVQPTPEVASETAKLYVRGVIATEGRLMPNSLRPDALQVLKVAAVESAEISRQSAAIEQKLAGRWRPDLAKSAPAIESVASSGEKHSIRRRAAALRPVA